MSRPSRIDSPAPSVRSDAAFDIWHLTFGSASTAMTVVSSLSKYSISAAASHWMVSSSAAISVGGGCQTFLRDRQTFVADLQIPENFQHFHSPLRFSHWRFP
ncbi:hypothetical protein QCE62_26085 [Caballeronia sp. LZ033]|uniref:hypothetical protein n=1 Tax=Caballeronia sp. LZ033 TaxID=3038566 RepID=UPI002861972C|nr:hypothetical protein [Caballeronia sp. LZ033]MDR5817073.1 hypothetical protein [Caballeronia sp. LZ033]